MDSGSATKSYEQCTSKGGFFVCGLPTETSGWVFGWSCVKTERKCRGFVVFGENLNWMSVGKAERCCQSKLREALQLVSARLAKSRDLSKWLPPGAGVRTW
jgi:hypothetical protein